MIIDTNIGWTSLEMDSSRLLELAIAQPRSESPHGPLAGFPRGSGSAVTTLWSQNSLLKNCELEDTRRGRLKVGPTDICFDYHPQVSQESFPTSFGGGPTSFVPVWWAAPLSLRIARFAL